MPLCTIPLLSAIGSAALALYAVRHERGFVRQHLVGLTLAVSLNCTALNLSILLHLLLFGFHGDIGGMYSNI